MPAPEIAGAARQKGARAVALSLIYPEDDPELPKEIGELTNLLYLEIGNNKLMRLPEEIKYLTNLQELHIERNMLSDGEKQRIRGLLPNCVIHF